MQYPSTNVQSAGDDDPSGRHSHKASSMPNAPIREFLVFSRVLRRLRHNDAVTGSARRCDMPRQLVGADRVVGEVGTSQHGEPADSKTTSQARLAAEIAYRKHAHAGSASPGPAHDLQRSLLSTARRMSPGEHCDAGKHRAPVGRPGLLTPQPSINARHTLLASAVGSSGVPSRCLKSWSYRPIPMMNPSAVEAPCGCWPKGGPMSMSST